PTPNRAFPPATAPPCSSPSRDTQSARYSLARRLPVSLSPCLLVRSCLRLPHRDRRQSTLYELAHEIERRLLAGEQLELQCRLPSEQVDAGDDVGVAALRFLDEQCRFR